VRCAYGSAEYAEAPGQFVAGLETRAIAHSIGAEALGMQRLAHIVEPDPHQRECLSSGLRRVGVEPVAFASGADALESWGNLPAGCGLLSSSLLHEDSLEILGRMQACRVDTPVIMVGERPDLEVVTRALRAGAAGFLETPPSRETLSRSIDQVFAELPRLIERERQRREALDLFSALTRRERDVVELVVDGRSNRQIAEALRIGVRTVEMHRSNLMEKLRVSSVAALIHFAIRSGIWIPEGGIPATGPAFGRG
jgi:two-component system response regulator FixJ